MNESQTRLEKIDPKLKEAGWGIVAQSRTLTEQFTLGKIGSQKRRPKKADYILLYKGVKLAIIEAKSDEYPAAEGVMQLKNTLT